jgi:peptidoglycan/xylan/chitin deacetylase (PgdA/CDA1 family)
MRSVIRSIYRNIYAYLPQQGKVLASRLASAVSGEPVVFHKEGLHPGDIGPRGCVVFSVDFELAWAWQYARRRTKSPVEIGLRERAQVPLILAKMEEYRIPATWATVGHLLLDRCSRGEGGLAHPSLPRPPHFRSEYWEFTAGDWLQHDPCTDVNTDPAWYAPDLVEAILKSGAGHEVACHGFSHLGFGPCTTPEVAAAEVDACLEAARRLGIRPTTWVFPGNEEGHFDILASKGFKVVRAFPEPYVQISLPVKRNDGMWRVHDSSAVDLEGEGWDFAERLRRLKRFVDKAAETKLAAHFWFHPSLPPDQMSELLFHLFAYCARRREEGAIDVVTMDGLATLTQEALCREEEA